VVLVSVDPEYFPEDTKYVRTAAKILDKHKLACPSVFLPGGWSDVQRTFNLSGYGNIVVDAKGMVRGINSHGKQLEKLVRSLVGPSK